MPLAYGLDSELEIFFSEITGRAAHSESTNIHIHIERRTRDGASEDRSIFKCLNVYGGLPVSFHRVKSASRSCAARGYYRVAVAKT